MLSFITSPLCPVYLRNESVNCSHSSEEHKGCQSWRRSSSLGGFTPIAGGLGELRRKGWAANVIKEIKMEADPEMSLVAERLELDKQVQRGALRVL